MQPILIHRAVLEKLQCENKVKKILTSNISEIYGSILWRKELSRLVYKMYLYKKFESDKANFTPVMQRQKITFFINYFFFPKILNKKTKIEQVVLLNNLYNQKNIHVNIFF